MLNSMATTGTPSIDLSRIALLRCTGVGGMLAMCGITALYIMRGNYHAGVVLAIADLASLLILLSLLVPSNMKIFHTVAEIPAILSIFVVIGLAFAIIAGIVASMSVWDIAVYMIGLVCLLVCYFSDCRF